MILAYHAHGSRIHGRGLFAGKAGRAGERVSAPAFEGTDHLGFNHSCDPNMRWIGNDGPLPTVQWVLVRPVRQGEELTLDYGQFGNMVPRCCLCPVCVL